MERHHEAALNQALDQLYLHGAVSILWENLYLWFNADRLGKNAYRELIRRWEELCTITHGYLDAPEVFVLEGDSPYLNLQRRAFPKEEKLAPLTMWA